MAGLVPAISILGAQKAIDDTQFSVVMYGRPPLGKGFFSAVRQTVGSGHVSGLFARCIDRWP
jgi:hypothetical protein